MAKIYTRQEVKRRKINYRIFAGIYDFLAAVAGIVVIVACAFLLVALVNWIVRDGQDSFASLWQIFQDAIIIPN